MILRASLALALASAADPSFLVGTAPEVLPNCTAYGGALCADGGAKVMVRDAATDKLVARYTFDDGRGLDSSGHGLHARVAPLAGPGQDPGGAGAWFDGAASMVVPHSPLLASNDLTVSFWMYLLEDSTSSHRTILRKAASREDMTPAIMLLPSDRRLHVRIGLSLGGAGESTTAGFDSTAVIPLRRWTHVAVVLKGGAALTLFVNGVKDCPVLGSSKHGAGCPPAGATYAWEEGDVLHNEGPLYVGADPYMAGTPMFLDTLSIHARALPEREIVAEAGGALGPAGPFFIALGCAKCTAESLMQHCSELDEHHPCLCQELMGGGLQVARVQGWLRGPSERWNFHADAPAAGCPVTADGAASDERVGFCCRDTYI